MKRFVYTLLIMFAALSVSAQVKEDDNEVAPPELLVNSEGNVVGAIGGTVDISALGGATYTIPIQVPDGVGGMQPNLSIVYNSQSGNGLLGWGWNLGGLSAITRVGQTPYHDNNVTGVSFTYLDRFALDGQRLRPLNGATNGLDGTEYRTEVDGMMKIKSFNRRDSESGGDISPACFRVWTPDGRVLEYGSSTSNEAKVFYRDDDGTQHTAIWLLRRVEDEYGNYMEYHYRIGEHDYRLEDIQFSGYNDGRGTDYGIDFHYYEGQEKRKDVETLFIGDFTLHSPWLLKDISVYHYSKSLYNYEFEYDMICGQHGTEYPYNRLKSVHFSDGNGFHLKSSCISYSEIPVVTHEHGTPCFYDENFEGYTTAIHVDGNAQNAEYFKKRLKFSGDFNGDGLMDFISAQYMPVSKSDSICIDSKSGEKASHPYAILQIHLNRGNTKTDLSDGYINFETVNTVMMDSHELLQEYPAINEQTNAIYYLKWVVVCDFDGDGKDDFILYRKRNNTIHLHAFKSDLDEDGNTTFVRIGFNSLNVNSYWYENGNDKEEDLLVGDFMGRGKQDLIYIPARKWNNNPQNFIYFTCCKNSTGCWISTEKAKGAIKGSCFATGDYNGDGKTEIWYACDGDNNSGKIAAIYKNDYSNNMYDWCPLVDNFLNANCTVFNGDFNGDGKTDILSYNKINGVWKVHLMSANGCPQSYEYFVTGEIGEGYDPGDYNNSIEERRNGMNYFLSVADMNEDGKSDIILKCKDGYLRVLYAPIYHNIENGDAFTHVKNNLFTSAGLGGADPYTISVSNYLGQGNASLFYMSFLFSECPMSTYYNAKTITDGMGNQVAFDYGYLINNPMKEDNIYSINEIGVNQGHFDIYNVPIPIRAVKSISSTNVKVSDKTMPISKTDYTYANAMVHKKGRGFLGFEGITSESSLVEKVTKDIAEATRKIGKTVQAFSFKPMGEHPMVVLDTNSVFRYKTNDECVLVATTRYEYQKFICKLDMGLSNDPNSKKLLTFMPMVKRTETSNFELLGERNGLLRKSISENQYNHVASGGDAYYVNTVQMTNSKQGTDGTDVYAVEQCEYQSETATQYEEDVTSQNQWIINRPHTVSTTMKRKTPGFQDSKSLTVYKYNRVFQRLPETVTTYPCGEQSTTDRLATKVTYTYNDGHIETETLSAPNDPNLASRTTSYGYDPRYRFVTSTTNPMGYVSGSTYDAVYGELKTTTDCNGFGTYSEDVEHLGLTTRTYDLDAQGNRIKGTESVTAQRWLSEAMKLEFASGLPDALYYSWAKTTGSAPSFTIYDAAGRALRSVSYGLTMQDVVFKDTKYDQWGRVYRQSEPYFKGNAHDKWTTFTYDNFDRVVRTDYPSFELEENGTNTTYYPYTALTYQDLTTTTETGASLTLGENDGHSHTISTTLNFMGWTESNVEELEEGENTTSYEYNADGSLARTRVNEQDFTKVSMTYDNAGNRIMLCDPDYGTVSEVYDAFGQLKSSTTPKRDVTTYEYDLLGRQTKRTETDKSVTPNVVEVTDWNYSTEEGKKGLLDNISFADRQTIAYTYDGDNYNRLSKVSETRSNVTYETTYNYENADFPLRATTVQYPTSYSVTKEYQEQTGRLYQIKHDETVLWETIKMNEYGQITDFTLGNGVTSTYTYDDRHLLSSQSAVKNGQKIQDFAYTYDIFANLAARTENKFAMPITESFTYDKLNRLKTATHNGSATGVMDYDAYGRILSKTEGGEIVFSDATYDDRHKPHAIREAESSGNVLIDPHAIDYTMFDKAKHISSPAGTIDITYGYNHERIKMVRKVDDMVLSEKRYIGNCEIEGVSIRTYISGPMGVFAVYELSDYKSGDDGKNGGYEGLRYIHKDHLGSWTTITDEEGNIEQELSFDAWGNFRNPYTWTGANTTRPMFDRGFTGHEHLYDFGLINMNGRMYDPIMSSFLSVDNYVSSPDFSQAFNRYAYCLNNPLKYTDPDGEFPWIPMLIGAGISVTTNGIDNLVNGDGFFKGAGKAALFGGIQGLCSFGIGQVASGISSVGARVAFQTIAHGSLGGVSSTLNGGTFAQGFVSGAASSLVATGMGGLTQDMGKFGQAIGTVGGGALAGGVGSSLCGGSFWDGFRNGAISSGLNHAVHTGVFGKGLMMASITGRTRHLFGPDARTADVSINATAGVNMSSAIGGIYIENGPDKGFHSYDDLGIGVGGLSASISLESVELYSSEEIVTKTDFSGPRYVVNASASIAHLSIGGNFVYSPHIDQSGNSTGGYTIGFGPSIGVDVMPLDLNVNVNYGASSIGNLRNLPNELRKAFKL